MENKSDSNHDITANSNMDNLSRSVINVGRDYNDVTARDMTGVVIGGGSINNPGTMANGSVRLTPADVHPENAEEFAKAIVGLKELIVEARDTGQLDESLANKALDNLDETADLVKKDGSASQGQIVRRLQYVADVLDTAVDVFMTNGGAAGVIMHALPIVNLLIKFAGRIF